MSSPLRAYRSKRGEATDRQLYEAGSPLSRFLENIFLNPEFDDFSCSFSLAPTASMITMAFAAADILDIGVPSCGGGGERPTRESELLRLWGIGRFVGGPRLGDFARRVGETLCVCRPIDDDLSRRSPRSILTMTHPSASRRVGLRRRREDAVVPAPLVEGSGDLVVVRVTESVAVVLCIGLLVNWPRSSCS